MDDALRDGGRQQRLPAGDGANGGEQLLGRVVLQDEAAGPGAEGFVDVLIEVERGQDQDPNAGVGRKDPPRCLESVELGHPDVHQHHGRREPRGLVDRLEPIARLGDHLDVGLAGEQHAEARAHHRLVVGDEHADAHTAVSTGSRALRMKPPSGAGPADISPP
jgi:hypothetical protein